MHTLGSVNPDNNMKEEKNDQPSMHGRFEWSIVGNSCVPCLLKNDFAKYVSVRIAESKVLSHFLLQFNSQVFTCVSVKSFGITESEMKLLNEINSKHCEFAYGREPFSMDKDFIVKLEDLIEFYKFMDVCYSKLRNRTPLGMVNKCGFVRINDDSVVPYAMKNGQKYVPLFYFEGETESLKTKAINLENWDLAYLKFCCKVQGIKNELFASEQCLVTSLEDVKSYFPEGTRFDDYWPTNVVEMQTTRNDVVGNHAWVQTPHIDTTALSQSTVPNTSHTIINKTLPPAISKQVVNNQRISSTSVINNVRSSDAYPIAGLWQTSSIMGSSGNARQSVSYQTSAGNHQRLAPKQTSITAHSMNSNLASTSRSYGNQPTRPQPQYFPPASQILKNISSSAVASQQPPPLVKVQTTISNTYTNQISASSYPQIYSTPSVYSTSHLNNTSVSQASSKSRKTASNQMISNATRYPPALNPLNGTSTIIQTNNSTVSTNVPSNGNLGSIGHLCQRIIPNQSTEIIIDLSSPPHSPENSNSSISRMPSVGSVNNFSGSKSSTSHYATVIAVPEMLEILALGMQPFQIQSHPVKDKTVRVINLEPNNMTSKLAITLYEVHIQFFPKMSSTELAQALLKALKCDLYRPNSIQKNLLQDLNKQNKLDDPDDYTLILMDDFNKFFTHLTFLQNLKTTLDRERCEKAKNQLGQSYGQL